MFIVFSSSISFLCGSIIGNKLEVFFVKSKNISYELNPNKYYKVVIIFTFIGFLSIIIFLISVHFQFGIDKFILSPSQVRIAMSKNEFIDPSKLFQYANIVLPVLIYFGYTQNVFKSKTWVIILILSLTSNLLFTGRTRFTWSLNWLTFSFLVNEELKQSKRSYFYYTFYFILFISLNLLSFIIIASWLGKYMPTNELSIENNAITENTPTIIQPVAYILYYLGVNLPYLQLILDEQLTENCELILGNSLLPYYKTLALINNRIEVPSEILEFKNVGLLSNTGTWLIQWWFDVGLTGILLLPFLVGLLAGHSLAIIKHSKFKPLILYYIGLLYTIIWFGFIGNKFMSTPTWIFIALGIAIFRFCQNKNNERKI